MRNLYWWEWLLIALFLFYAVCIVCYMRNLLVNKLHFLLEHGDESKVEEKWKPFVRYDRKTWSLLEIYICAVFILPIRVVILIICACLGILFSCCCTCHKKGQDPQTIEQSSFKRGFYKGFIRVLLRICLFALGVLWIPKKYKKISDYDITYPQQQYKDRKDNPPLLIGNHVGYLEAMYFATTKYCPSFVAKKSISNLPILGSLGKTLQCIFVDRGDNSKRNQVLELIVQRCKFIKEGKNFPPIAMFPEGTCSNGKYILSFKKGAFEAFAPIKIFYFKFYDRHFSPYLDSIPLVPHILISLCQFMNKFEVNEFDTFYPDHLNLQKEEEWIIYANKIKEIMLKASNFKNSESGYRDVMAYEKFIQESKHKLVRQGSSQQLHRKMTKTLTLAGQHAQEEEHNLQDIENFKDENKLLNSRQKIYSNELNPQQNENTQNNGLLQVEQQSNIENNTEIKNKSIQSDRQLIQNQEIDQKKQI